MREHKFKAWHISEKRWINLNGLFIEFFGCTNPGFVYSVTEQGVLHEIDIKDVALVEWTGLKDKNGVEIFEGDICTYIGTHMSEMEIKFENGCFIGEGLFTSPTLKDLMNAIDFESIEVTGNIFQPIQP